MEEVKVSELPVATNVNDEDLVMIVQDGYNKQVTKEDLLKETENEIETLDNEINPTAWTNVTLGSSLSGGTIRYAKLGNLVIVTIRNLTTANVLTGGTILAQGLPASAVGENFLMSNYAATNNDLNCLIGMSTAGVLSIIGDTMYASGAQYFAQFMYITTE